MNKTRTSTGQRLKIAVVPFLLLLGLPGVSEAKNGGHSAHSMGKHALIQAITGKVTGEKEEPLPGVSVVLKGTTQGTTTDANGKFSLDVAEGAVLIFSFIGYQTTEVAVNGRSSLSIQLQPDQKTLDEVVVVGYGTQRKSDLTGAISSVSAKDLAKATPINTTDALQGRAAGVMVSTNSGSPGSEGTIRIRGIGTVNNNDPLYVVDGMFVNSINFLSPSDIARLEVLKDASATAIYGSRGANGVVLITTHKGASGKPTIVFNATTSISRVSNLMKTLNRDQFLDYQKTAYLNGYLRSTPNADPTIDPFTTTNAFFNSLKIVKTQYDKGYYTNWADELLKTASIQNYDLAIRGGSATMRYAASAAYFDQKGIIDNSSYKRYNFRLNTDYNLGKRLVVGENVNITASSILGGAGFAEGRSNSTVAQILQGDPLSPILNPNPNVNDPDYQYNKYAASVTGAANPAATIARINDKNNLFKIVGNVYGELELLKGLKLRTSFGYDYNNIDNPSFNPRYYISAQEQNATSSVTQNDSTFFGQLWENTLNYNTKIGKHAISGLLGYTEELYKGQFVRATRQGTANNDPALQVLNAATGAISLTGNKTQYALQSYFARVNYVFADKYLLTATVRRDGSSKFAPDYQWGTFPSISTGWHLSDEHFFQNLRLDFVSDIKLRAGWGQIGNQNMPGGTNNPYLSLVENTNNYRYIFGDAIANGNYLTSLGTPSIHWETSQQTNIGLDLGLANNRLTISADYFVKNTRDMLLQVALPSYAGFPKVPYTNAGNIQNKGVELVVGYAGSAGKLTYSLSANASRFVNKVVSLGTGDNPIAVTDPYTNLSVNRTEVGRTVGEFYGYVTDGIFQNTGEVNAYTKDSKLIQPNALPGDFRFKDLNGDGVINASDRTFIGNPLPKLTYGFNLNLSYQHFDLAILFQGAYGNKLFNANKKYNNILNGTGGASLKAYEAAWRGEGTSNTQPIMSSVDRNDNFRVSDWYVEDGSYLRLKNLQIGYKLTGSWVKKAGISSSRIWVGGTDLLTITKYTGNDPEAGLAANPLQAGWDFSPYPKMKRFSLGVNVTF
ncbi:SusC/RagA family TonB-linked outer membrane protein [Spirosoma sp. HMF4905]|uniref:SusC/RagA family TonB-linked outer membrane protein n=1 Tax=Spirosoma arboris TaxID=2682092 RepID=A0A7K1SAV3_9BACT|nr:TonB-dependent receptor [Spirosoma arboris]MVM30944.1 SusC/RagA family TonB-linked outer membrane protein [Spirosoma arboris]